MKQYTFQWCLFIVILFFNQNLIAQFSVQGKITFADSNSAIEKVNILNLQSNVFTTTDKKGKFKMENVHDGDSIRFSKVGVSTVYIIATTSNNIINISMKKNKESIEGVKVFAKGDMISNIMKKVQKNKDANNPFTDAMEVEVYNNITLRLNELDQLKGKSGAIKKIIREYRTANPTADTTFIPVFLSEANSDLYIRSNPSLQKEIIKYTQVKSLGLASDGIVNELVGSSFQAANFYNEQIRFLGRNFTSPINANWKNNFKYIYGGTEMVDGKNCFHLTFTPKNSKDVEFSGEMYIESETYSLFKIKVFIDDRANINYVKAFTIEQFFDKPEGYNKYYPVENVMDIAVSLNRKDGLGMQAHLSSSALKVKSTEPKEIGFYLPATQRLENSIIRNDSLWNTNRSNGEIANTQNTIAQIASIENSPTISRLDKTFRFLIGGYAPTKSNMQLGTYFNAIAFNNVEGMRLALGGRGRDLLPSKRLLVEGYLAYGFKDKKIKYMANANYILSKKPWITIGAKYENDVRRLGITTLLLNDNTLNAQFIQLTNHWGNLRKAYQTQSFNASIFHEIAPGITHKFTFINEVFNPLYQFQYFEKNEAGQPQVQSHEMKVTELNYEFNFNKGEVLVRNNTKRAIKLKRNREGFNYVFKVALGQAGNVRKYEYAKFYAEINKRIPMNKFGVGNLRTAFSYSPSLVPYPLLYIHIGNPTPVYSQYALNTMNFFEFTTDKNARVQYIHDFGGYITNRIPLIRKLNWRTHFTASSLWGTISDANQALIPLKDSNGVDVPRVKTFRPNKPFVEAGFGVSNIFKVLRVDFFHRFTYNEPQPHHRRMPVHVKFSVAFGL
jgi:Family of unknown function (DUF5686)/CarboxypepD_reg-like domain